MTQPHELALAHVPFFAGLETAELAALAVCARETEFAMGHELFRTGRPADTFYVLRAGSVALETFVPMHGTLRIETIEAGDVVGWSWLFPPYRWHFDGRALTDVRATAFDGRRLRELCDTDATLGYDLMQRFARVLVDRLQWTRLRLLDVYGGVGGH